MNGKIPQAEQDLLEQAIEALEHDTGLVLTIMQMKAPFGDERGDALLRLEPAGVDLIAEIKKWAPQANLGALINQVRQMPGKGILVADYINPNMAERLRQEAVQFIDTLGNAYINQPPVYVFVARTRTKVMGPGDTAKTPAMRAFEPKGLVVTYAFLVQRNLVNAPYRYIARGTDVAVGTVNKVIDALKTAGFIREEGRKADRRMVAYEKLLNRWIEAWPDKLKPKQFVGEFAATNPYWWKNINIENYGGYWGGEIAGAMYTDYLKPEIATVYIPEEHLKDFLMDMRLRKVTDQNENTQARVMIYHPFWDERMDVFEPIQKPGVVHPVLAYADLVATGETRNLEVAQIIYDNYIAKYYGED